MSRLSAIGCTLVVIGCAAPRPLQAQKRDEPRVVLLVRMGSTAQERLREQRFVRELRLALDGLAVVAISPSESFRRMTLPDQLVWLRPEVKRRSAVAVVWMVPRGGRHLVLHLVALTTGRAVVRLVEEKAAPRAEATLALATRELLGTAYLFEQNVKNKAIARVVKAVRQRVGKSPPRPWSLRVEFRFDGGVVGGKNPWLNTGGAFALERRFGRLHLQVGMGAHYGPWWSGEGTSLEAMRLAPAVALSYTFPVGKVFLGPLVAARFHVEWWKTQLGQFSPERHFRWRPEADLGAELRWRFAGAFSLVAALGLGILPLGERFRRTSDAEVVYQTPLVSAWASLGITVRL